MSQSKVGLVLSGGGARAAYQAGALRGIAEILSSSGVRRPFPIISGSSAGAINAAYLACRSDNLVAGSSELVQFWSQLRSHQVYHTGVLALSGNSVRWGFELISGSLQRVKSIKSLLDTAPLRRLLQDLVPLNLLEDRLRRGDLEALEVGGTDYGNSDILSFVQAASPNGGWNRLNRRSQFCELTIDHLMASAAIPIIFPPVKIGSRYYGDGCLRNPSPMAPAIYLGANRLLVIGTKYTPPGGYGPDVTADIRPSLARIVGVLLHSVLLDAISLDMQRLIRINETVALIPPSQLSKTTLRPIEVLVIQPSLDISQCARRHLDALPRGPKFLLKGLGSEREAAELLSYLLFEGEYCGELAAVGYRDAWEKKSAIVSFFQQEVEQAGRPTA